MSDLLADVHVLADEIGPRGTGTRAERDAAAFVAQRLQSLGLSAAVQEFPAVVSQNAFPLAIDVVVLLAAVLYAVGGAPGRWIAALLGLSAAPLLLQTILTSRSLLSPILPKVGSQNVIARVDPLSQPVRRVVLLSHLDTNRCRIAWQSGTVRHLEPLTWLTLGMLDSLGTLFLVGAFLDGVWWIWCISLVPTAYVIGTVLTLWLDESTPFSPGAHDNAASVAVALGLAERLREVPLSSTEIILAFTGAEETDHAGLYTLLRSDPTAMRDAAFIGLEGLGSGELVYLKLQGLCFRYEPDLGLLSIAERVAAKRPELGAGAARMPMEDEVGTLRRRGYRAICVAGLDATTGSLPYWHREDDVADHVSAEFMARATEYVLALLREMDGARRVGDVAEHAESTEAVEPHGRS